MMNNLSHVIRSFNRFELKYILPLEQAAAFKAALSAWLIPDENGGATGSYSLTSLYYDSPDYRCYREKLDGLKYRRKLRIRVYGSCQDLQDDSPVMVEIKQRHDRVTQKRRALLPYSQALRLCSGRTLPEHAADDRAAVEEVLAFVCSYNLQPASIVRYQRQAFIGTDYDIGLRVTFDTHLTYQLQPLDIHRAPNGAPLLRADHAVMEIKVNERLPYWLSELVARHNLNLARVSKYCASIQAASAAQCRLPY